MTSSVEVLEALSDTSRHGLLTLTNPDSGIEVPIALVRIGSQNTYLLVTARNIVAHQGKGYSLLVWLILSIRVTDLLQDVVLLVQNVVSNTSQVCVLQISIKVDLDDTVANSIQELLLG